MLIVSNVYYSFYRRIFLSVAIKLCGLNPGDSYTIKMVFLLTDEWEMD